jgi:hypothetical protein
MTVGSFRQGIREVREKTMEDAYKAGLLRAAEVARKQHIPEGEYFCTNTKGHVTEMVEVIPESKLKSWSRCPYCESVCKTKEMYVREAIATAIEKGEV